MNPHDETDRVQAMFACSCLAVKEAFGHLALRHIIHPPRRWNDAALARQIVVHLMVHRFAVPRRRTASIQGRDKSTVTIAIQIVERRLTDEAFASAYECIAGRAQALFDGQIQTSRSMKAAA